MGKVVNMPEQGKKKPSIGEVLYKNRYVIINLALSGIGLLTSHISNKIAEKQQKEFIENVVDNHLIETFKTEGAQNE